MWKRRLNYALIGPGIVALILSGLLAVQEHIVSAIPAEIALAITPFFGAGVLALLLRPDNVTARRLLQAGFCFAVFLPAIFIRWPGPLVIPAYALETLFLAGFLVSWVAAFAVFPDGSYQRRYERRVVRVLYLATPVTVALTVVGSSTVQDLGPAPIASQAANPLFVVWLAPFAHTIGLLAASPLVALLLLALRYRRAAASQRNQMRWPFLGSAVAGLMTVVSLVAPPPLQDPAWFMGVAVLPITVVVGILRDRLLDIDLLVRRTPAYAVLWLLIALAYAAVAVLLGSFAGQRLSVTEAVIITILAAMLFEPARRRLERIADRIVFGERQDGYQLLVRLGADLERTLELEEVGPAVAAAVGAGLQAGWVRVLVNERQRMSELAVQGTPEGAPQLISNLVYAGEVVGAIECGPRPQGPYGDADRALLDTIARQVALAVNNLRQARELAASRNRLLVAQESERRRIERNIHDGVQQEVVALMAKAEVAKRLQPVDGAASSAALAEVGAIARQLLADLRELATGIHPAVLDDQGLIEAVEARATLLPIGVRIHADPSLRERRFDADVEAAAYFLISESLTNVMKHSGAGVADVRLSVDDGHLRVQVSDEGRGFVLDPGRTRGVQGLADRLGALGGRLEVHSQPGSGVTLEGVLPCA